ncbi:MAG: LysR family transcriptional regulator [Crocosphaera sp.]|nr:LysR family transcriptional regulator [Crocosphaera sp.]
MYQNLYNHLYSLEFKQLIFFLIVAEQGTITKAADILNIHSPNLSTQIQRLERQLNVNFFDRSNKRSLKLTEAGQIFLEQVNLILTQTSQAIYITQQAERGEIGRLSIGFNSSASNTVLPNILSNFRQEFPNIKLENMRCSTADNLINDVKKQAIDVILIHWSEVYESQEDLEIMTLKEEPLIVVLPQDHPLASETEISLQALHQEQFILPPSTLTYSIHQPVMMYCQNLGCIPNHTTDVTLMLTIINLVAGGLGVSILPENARSIQRSGVVYKDIKESIPPVEIVAAWRRDNKSKTLENFVNVLKELPK